MDPTITQWWFKERDQVCDADDHKLGKVVDFVPDAMNPTYLVPEKGLLIHHDDRVPTNAVCNYEGGTIYLDLTKDQVVGGA